MVRPEILSPDLFDVALTSTVPLTEDDDLARVLRWFRSQPDMEKRFGSVLRKALDEVLDGQRTGRFDIDELGKTEKTYIGTKVEIVCQAEFELTRGKVMDYRVDGVEVDAKFSLSKPLGQSIPREAMGHICLLMHAHDRRSHFSIGLLRITEDVLNLGRNQDGKRTLSPAAKRLVVWLVEHGRLPENILLGLDPLIRARVFDAARKSGQAGINELFKQVQGRIIKREVVLAVAKQDDPAKRVRDARGHLRPDGILILGHQNNHPHIAQALHLPKPDKGSWISVRVIPCADSRPHTVIGGVLYAVAEPTDRPQPGPEEY